MERNARSAGATLCTPLTLAGGLLYGGEHWDFRGRRVTMSPKQMRMIGGRFVEHNRWPWESRTIRACLWSATSTTWDAGRR